MQQETPKETTLDPQDWEATRALAHQMVDDALDYLRDVRERPVWRPIPAEAREYFTRPVPRQPEGEAQAYQDFKDYVFDHPMGNIHPRFWGWVMGGGIPYAVLADMLAATMNPNMGGGDHGGVYVERQVIEWCKEMLGYPVEASGLLVSGGSMANYVGLAVARSAKAGYDVRAEGVAAAPAPMTVYASSETHSSNYKAIELLGLGKNWLRLIPVDQCYAMDAAALEAAIHADKAAGYRPICVIGNAGTVNTGAFDDLNRLADVCQREDLWFHVDGAFGALAALSERHRPLTAGLERADSLAFDLHKWMYMPFEVACVLVRSFREHVETFAVSPDYLSHMPRGLAGGQQAWYSELGLQLTRGFRALKVWMALKAYGLDHFKRQIEQDVDHARYLVGLVEGHPRLELLAPAPLNIVCFRYTAPGLAGDALDRLNQEIMMRLHERGLAVPTYTRLDGRFALRVAITNHRSTCADFDFLVEKVVELGEAVQSGA
jgi:glutamate/tyrosine decarboxylase-like PLP-dependent enzyme